MDNWSDLKRDRMHHEQIENSLFRINNSFPRDPDILYHQYFSCTRWRPWVTIHLSENN